MMVNCGAKPSRLSGRISRCWMNSACQARSVMTRTWKAVERIGAAEEVLHEDAAQSGMGEEILLQPGEAFRGHGGGCCPTTRSPP